ncbi:MAG TPA: hypothetical protein VHY35_03780 [Stellaceae bacterium]|jgi:hypothetical protein|nr:hypothetical protein [Stellaceae bacterium]
MGQALFDSGFEKRRLKLLNSLAMGLLKAGARMGVGGKQGRDISVQVGRTTVTLSLDHPTAKPNRQGEWQTRPGPADTLRLTIGIGGTGLEYRSVWQDADDAKLEVS